MKNNTRFKMNLQLLAATKEEGLTETLVKAKEFDFIGQFGNSVEQLLKVLRIENRLELSVGSVINTYKSSVTLQGEAVGKGEIIPLSEVKLEKGEPIELTWNKHRKAVAAEDVQKYGYDNSIEKTDTELLRAVQKGVKTKFFTQLKTAVTTVNGVGLQGALAAAWGSVATKFEDDEVTTIAFINPLDVADYLANANITTQEVFGLRYVEGFLGVDVAIITTLVEKGTLYATAAGNLNIAYANLSNGELSKVFDFTTDETGLIGITHDLNKARLTAETVTASALEMFAERTDGIVKATIKAPTVPEAK